jgi:flagellar biosynthesis/type III secretory pathway M-ring protein FliF/YscJ
MNIVALLALVAGIVAVSFIAWIFIVELANRYGERRAERDREELTRKAEREPTDERS